MDTALLLLADARLPAGGHAHSGGLEAAVAAGRVTDVSTLDGFLRGRLATAGLVAAAFAAAACAAASPTRLAALDLALDARTPSPTLRRVSRAQGRALLRAGRAMWPVAGEPAHHAVVLGAVAAAAGLGPRDAALAAAHLAVTGPASAAVRLLGLDPYAVQALLARLAPACDRTADGAAACAGADPAALPAAGAPLLDLDAEDHARWEVRLFAS
jgi:urease accessory protein